MTATRTPKTSRANLLAQLSAIAAILVVAWFLWSRAQPERLIEADFGIPRGKIHAGQLYWTVDDSGARIMSRPLTGGPERAAVTEEPQNRFYVGMLAPSGQDILYGVVPRPKPTKYSGSYSAGNGSAAKRYLGIFAAIATNPVRPAKTQEKRVTRATTNVGEVIVRVRRAAGNGGTARDVRVLPAANALLIEHYAFWTRPKPGTETSVTHGNDTWTEVSGHDDVLWTDLDSGAERVVRSSCSPSRMLVSESGVIWTEPRAFPDDSRDLYYARATDGAVLHLGQVAKNARLGWFAEWQGSLYWTVIRGIHEVDRSFEHDRLMAADLSGAGERTVFKMSQPNRAFADGQNLIAWRGCLYCIVTDVDGAQLQGSAILARVHPRSANPLEIVCKLPANAVVLGSDGGYLYYIASEAHRGILETILDEHQHERRSETLFRIPLPD